MATLAGLVQSAQSHGLFALGFTDHYLLTGAVEFVFACQEAGVQPILGLEVDLEQGPLQLLTMSEEGWSNLCRLSSTLALREEPGAICPLEMLAANSQYLVALRSVQLEGLKMKFQDRLYVSLRHSAEADRLSGIARKLGLPTVVTHPVYYLSPNKLNYKRGSLPFD